MFVITQTVTVNAAFLQEIKEDDLELWSLLQRLEFSLLGNGEPRLSRQEIFTSLAQLRDQLAMHFALEEAYGYFENAIEVAPRLSAKAERLRDEHKTFYLDICDLVARAEEMLHEDLPGHHLRELMSRFDEFLAALRRHESTENQLIQQAFTEEIGGWD